MIDDYDWTPKVTNRVPLWISELDREATVEWVIERSDTEFGTLQVEYTRCDDLNRPFVGKSVTASVWMVLEEDDGVEASVRYSLVDAKADFMSLALAKRWTIAQAELHLVVEANEYLLSVREDDDDPFGLE